MKAAHPAHTRALVTCSHALPQRPKRGLCCLRRDAIRNRLAFEVDNFAGRGLDHVVAYTFGDVVSAAVLSVNIL